MTACAVCRTKPHTVHEKIIRNNFRLFQHNLGFLNIWFPLKHWLVYSSNGSYLIAIIYSTSLETWYDVSEAKFYSTSTYFLIHRSNYPLMNIKSRTIKLIYQYCTCIIRTINQYSHQTWSKFDYKWCDIQHKRKIYLAEEKLALWNIEKRKLENDK